MNDFEPADSVQLRATRTEQKQPRRALPITLAVSVGLHLIAVTVALLLLHAGVPKPDTPEKPAEVELVMEEHKGDNQPVASKPPSPPAPDATPPKQQSKAAPPPAEAPMPPMRAPVDARPDTPEDTSEPAVASNPAPAKPPAPEQKARAPSAPPAPPAEREAPTITLQGTDSPSNAKTWGPNVIPAAPDAVFHNRPPEYPPESVMNGEHGTVVVVIHVSPAGTAAGVDVLRSSGYVLLDRAVRVAVMRWRFLPAVEAGEPVPSNVTMGFVFDYE